MAPTEKRTAPLGLRVRPSLKADLEKLAIAEKRTTASYVELVLEAHVAAKKAAGKRK